MPPGISSRTQRTQLRCDLTPMDMYTVQVRGGDVVRAVVGHKVRVPFCSRCPLIATHSSSFHPHGCTHAQVAAVGLMDDRLAAVDSPLPSTIAALKPLRPHVHRFDVLGPLRRHRRRRVLPSRHCPHPKTSPPPLAPLSTAQRRQRLSTNLEVPSLPASAPLVSDLSMAMYVPLAPHNSSSSPAGPQHGPALVFPLALHLAPVHCRLRRTCAAHFQPPALAGVRSRRLWLRAPTRRPSDFSVSQASRYLLSFGLHGDASELDSPTSRPLRPSNPERRVPLHCAYSLILNRSLGIQN
jgi:hypothetical protein